MGTYLFFRDGHFYPVDGINSDAEALEHVRPNPGTLRVEHISGRVVWDAKRDPVPGNPAQ